MLKKNKLSLSSDWKSFLIFKVLRAIKILFQLLFSVKR